MATIEVSGPPAGIAEDGGSEPRLEAELAGLTGSMPFPPGPREPPASGRRPGPRWPPWPWAWPSGRSWYGPGGSPRTSFPGPGTVARQLWSSLAHGNLLQGNRRHLAAGGDRLPAGPGHRHRPRRGGGAEPVPALGRRFPHHGLSDHAVGGLAAPRHRPVPAERAGHPVRAPHRGGAVHRQRRHLGHRQHTSAPAAGRPGAGGPGAGPLPPRGPARRPSRLRRRHEAGMGLRLALAHGGGAHRHHQPPAVPRRDPRAGPQPERLPDHDGDDGGHPGGRPGGSTGWCSAASRGRCCAGEAWPCGPDPGPGAEPDDSTLPRRSGLVEAT